MTAPKNLIARLKLIARIAAARDDGDMARVVKLTAELDALQRDVPIRNAAGRLVGQMEDRRPKWKRGRP